MLTSDKNMPVSAKIGEVTIYFFNSLEDNKELLVCKPIFRQKMLVGQKSYMRLYTDDEITSFHEKDLSNLLKERKDFFLENSKSLTKEEVANQLKKNKRTRHPMFWHDGSSVSNHSHIIMTVSSVSCMHDDDAFTKNAEHYAKQ